MKSLSIEPRNDGDLYVQTAAYSIELELAARDGDVNDNNPDGKNNRVQNDYQSM